ncbi:MAG TPA: Spy/CpxP family protein refolding chaperone [Geobacteraceae bacterium]|nr:Spy/CpxP family protein refolding chaperone [Geobacteraceae bacterium]
MEKTCCFLLLSFCAIAATIYVTKGDKHPKQPVGILVSHPLPDHNGNLRHYRLAPVLHASNPLALTPEQINDITKLVENHQSVMKPLIRKITLTRKNIHHNIRSGKYDETSITSVMTGLTPVMAEALVERERLDADIFSILNKKQRKQAEELSRLADTFFTNQRPSHSPDSVAAGRMKTFFCLSDAQTRDVDRTVEEVRRKLSPLFKNGRNISTENNFASGYLRYSEIETRERARLQAEKISTILIASENVTAKVYGFLQENQKERVRDAVALIESCIRERILDSPQASVRQSVEAAKAVSRPTRQPLQLPAQYASTSMRH